VNVVDCVNNEIEGVPELIVEDGLGVGADSGLIVLHVEGVVHLFGDGTCDLRLGMANVVLSKEELSVEVGDLNVVVVSDGDSAFG